MSAQDVTSGGARAHHKRKLRNYLLDVGLQVRYTAFIMAIAVFLTAVLGYKIFEATQDSSKIIFMTGLVDPTISEELQSQFRANDRIVLFGVIGFGVLLVLSIFAAGIWITHKVAGPLYNMASVCARIRDGKMPAALRQLRKGDELQGFYSSFREMYDALRTRTATDVRVLETAIAALDAQATKSPQVQEVLAELRELRRQKEQSLEPSI